MTWVSHGCHLRQFMSDIRGLVQPHRRPRNLISAEAIWLQDQGTRTSSYQGFFGMNTSQVHVSGLTHELACHFSFLMEVASRYYYYQFRGKSGPHASMSDIFIMFCYWITFIIFEGRIFYASILYCTSMLT